MKERRIQYLRPEQIIREREKNSLVFLPLGPVEWHGPHLPMGVDALRAEAAALFLASRLGGLVLPTLFVGTERERSGEMLRNIGFSGEEYIVGMDFPANLLASLYYREETLAVVLKDLLEMVVNRWSFKRVVLVNGHGAENHLQVLRRLQNEFNARGSGWILLVMPMVNYPNGSWSHATLEETATMMFLYPSGVRLKALPSLPEKLKNVRWAIVDDSTFRGKPTADFTVREEEDPRLARKIIGKRLWKMTTRQLTAFLKSELNR
ncbi:MAG: creatininase family protein [Candidatus Omnitrophica bacterium]|nr:creatininase family protein [Candidatus Omnitrophota bacterium]